jgi:hypothetical protein
VDASAEPPGLHGDNPRSTRMDRLMDAIEMVDAERRAEARAVLHDLIREDPDFQDAWLWMSVAVDSLDQASICLDNVLRINPGNAAAATALYRIRVPELALERQRTRLRLARDLATSLLWMVIFVSLCGALASFMALAGGAGR